MTDGPHVNDDADKENRENSADAAETDLNLSDASPFRFYANALKQEQQVRRSNINTFII